MMRGLLLCAAAFGSALVAAERTTLTVTCSDVVPGGGTVHIALWRDATGWPDRPAPGATTASMPAPTGTELIVRFPEQALGPMAVSVYQDRNGNGQIDQGLFGPQEPWGTSRNCTHTFRGPDYHESLIDLGPTTNAITIIMHH